MKLIIKNVQIVDGEGGEPYWGDILIKDKIITAIGNLKDDKGIKPDQVIDGAGNYLTPGFIDIDTSSDQYLSIFTNPAQADFAKQGVTTIIGGHCGASAAPLLYGTLESLRKWADVESFKVDWNSLQELLDIIAKLPLGVNFGTMVGHSTIRRSLDVDNPPVLKSGEMRAFIKILEKALEEGAYGLSIGLGYAHGHMIQYEEMKELANLVKSHDGVCSIHLRNETHDLIQSVDEVIKLTNDTRVRALISHFRPIIGFEKQFDEAMNNIEKNSSIDNLRSYVYPFDTSLNALYTLLPIWAQERDLESMLIKLRDPDIAIDIERDLKDLELDRFTIADAPKNDKFVGKTIRDLSKIFKTTPIRALLKFMDITNMKALVFNKNINFEKLVEIIPNNRVFIASNAASRSDKFEKYMVHERALSTFPKYLDIVLGNGSMTLPKAIEKITSSPAKYFGIKRRGSVKVGNIADLNILDNKTHKVIKTFLAGQSNRGEVLKHKG